MRRLAWVAGMAAHAAFLGALPAAAQPAPTAQLAYSVAAPKEASYALACRFRAIRAGKRLGGGPVNNLTLSGKGPQRGRLPSDNARCTLQQTSDTGPIGLAVVKDRPYTAATSRRGQTAKLLIP